jgi:hypothetical protein
MELHIIIVTGYYRANVKRQYFQLSLLDTTMLAVAFPPASQC